ncbi:MAG: hypothetical protein HY905_10955 [Deltaproteobacteria bacterium]|nr:hypothetical protein [Deltaproteobacteria bacterium]
MAKKAPLLLFLVPAGLAGASACSSGADPRPDVSDAVEAEGSDGTDGGCEPGDEPLDLLGTWAARAWVDVYMVTPGGGIVHLCPDPRVYGVSLITLRVRVYEQTGTAVRHVFNVCRLQMPLVEAAIDPLCASTVGMQLAIGRPLTQQWPDIDYPGGAVLGGTGTCSTYVADPLVAVFGTDETIGATETLPTWRSGCESDPPTCVDGWEHVVDSDGDGHPGVTLTVTSEPGDLIVGEAYTAYRTVDLLRGVARSSSLILGEVEPEMDYQIIDSDVLVGGGPLPPQLVRDNIPIFEIPRAGSTFVLLRADGRYGADDLDADGSGEVTCDEILAAESIFAPYQP